MSYEYYKQIKSPAQLGMSENGSLGTLSRNIESLVDYVKLLVEGGGPASKTGRPLGDKYFVDTGASCVDSASGKSVERFMYVDNQPEGQIPFIGAGMGSTFSDFRGLIPGILDDIDDVNPVRIIKAFAEEGNPTCTNVTLQTIDKNGRMTYQTNHVPNEELENVAPCTFKDKLNPVTKKKCETFTNMKDSIDTMDMSSFGQGTIFEKEFEDVILPIHRRDIRNDILVGGTSIVLLYFLWKMYKK